MGRKTLAKMTGAEIDAEIQEIDDEPRKVQGHYTRKENLIKEKIRRLQEEKVKSMERQLEAYKETFKREK